MQAMNKDEIALVIPNRVGTAKKTDSDPVGEAIVQGLDKYKSPNCTDGLHETVMYTYFAHTEKNDMSGTMLSCQSTNFETCLMQSRLNICKSVAKKWIS